MPTECGEAVLERARRIRRELEALRADLSMLQGLAAGEASFGIVGTASRWVVPALVADLRVRAPGVRLRVNEAASERLVAEVAAGELAQAVVTEPVTDRRLAVETLLVEALVGVVPDGIELPPAPVPLAAPRASSVSCSRRSPTRCGARSRRSPTRRASRSTCRSRSRASGSSATSSRSGAGVSILPETAIPTELDNLRTVAVAELPPRRLALVNPRDAYLSLADRALRDSLLDLVVRARPPSVLSPPEPDR